MGEWNKLRLNQVLDYEQPTKYIVKTTDYDDSFKTPVLTAGKSFLLGHTNEATGIFKDVPAIIFDDFTTAFHYVNFPFKVKSSAMKILKANEDKADLRFLYYRMGRVRIDTALHKRYWISKFSQVEIPLPPLKTQKRIAQILDDAAALRDKTQQLLTEYDLLAQSIFLEMFGDPVLNPKGWEVKKLNDITNLITDGKHGNCNDENNSGYFFISAKDIRNNKINYTDARQIPKSEFEEVDRRTNLQVGDLVMVNTGATIGRMAIAKSIPETRKTTFQKSVAVIKTKKALILPLFLQYVFELRLDTFANKGSGSAIKNLLLSEMKRFKVIVPPLDRQNQFAEKIALIEKQKDLAKEELKESEDLFNCLMQKAFMGELVQT